MTIMNYSDTSSHEMGTDLQRWRRLELYSRWKQRRFVLKDLPTDVCTLLCSFLHPCDFMNLVLAYIGGFHACPQTRGHVDAVPVVLHPVWFQTFVTQDFLAASSSLGQALVCSLDQTPFLRAFMGVLDWSPFSPHACQPVMQVERDAAHGRAVCQYNFELLMRHAAHKMRIGVPMTRCTFHYYEHSGALSDHPIHMFCHRIYAPLLASKLQWC